MRLISALLLVTALGGCVVVDHDKYRGRPVYYDGHRYENHHYFCPPGHARRGEC